MAAAREVPVIDPATLRKDELCYELLIRRANYDEDDDTLRELRLKYTTHKDDEVDEEVLALLDLDDEANMLEPKILEIGALLAEANGLNLKLDTPYRVVSLFVHAVARIRRVMYRGGTAMTEKFLELGTLLNNYHDVFVHLNCPYAMPRLALPDALEKIANQMKKVKLEETEQPKKKREPATKESNTKSSKKKSKKKRERRRSEEEEESDRSDSREEESSSDSDAKGRKSGRRQNPVTKWNFSYSGSRGDDLRDFLDKVDDAADAHQVTPAELLRGISLLLTGSASSWYKTQKKHITKWTQFKKKIREAFEPHQEDEEILDQLRRLRQKDDETFVVFEARCDELFRQLSEPLSDSAKVQKVLKVLHPYYRSRVRLTDMDSMRALRRECKNMEADKAHILKMEHEEKRRDEKKKERRHEEKEEKRTKLGRVAAVQVSPSASETSESEPEVTVEATYLAKSPAILCWRCGQPGHLSYKCSEAIFCVVCGAQDTVAERCKRCAETQHWSGRAAAPAEVGNSPRDPGVAPLGPFTVPPPPVPSKIKNARRK